MNDPTVFLADSQQANGYAYVGNNPLNNIDPLGTKVEVVARGLNFKYLSFLGNWGVHTFLRITPDNPEDFGKKEGDYFTLGAYQNTETGKLEKEENQETDFGLTDENVKSVQTIETPEGMSDTEFIQSIQGEFDGYENDKDYSAFSVNGKGANCNNFTSTLVDGSGSTIPENFSPKGFNPGLGETFSQQEKNEED